MRASAPIATDGPKEVTVGHGFDEELVSSAMVVPDSFASRFLERYSKAANFGKKDTQKQGKSTWSGPS